MKSIEPKIVIGIPFRIWSDHLDQAIYCSLKLKYKNFSVVLAGNPPEEIPKKYFKNKKILFIRTKDVNIAVKRNTAIRKIKADYYACLDSDSYPSANWLANAISILQKDSSIWAVGGPNLSPIYPEIKRQAVGNALKSVLISGPRAFTKRRLKNKFTDDLPTCNLIIRKEVFDKIGLFNEKLATGEDTNLCTRIKKAGGKIYYSKDVVVYHHNRWLFLPFIRQKIVFGYAVIPLIKTQWSFRYYFLFPVVFILYLFFGWIPAFWFRITFYPWISLITVYIICALIESIRWSKNMHAVPLTFLAIIIGNIVPGIGTLSAIFNIRINIRKIYKNF